MKVLVLASWYPSNENPISGVFIREQIRALRSIGFNPVVFYPYDNSIVNNTMIKQVEDGVVVYRANTDYLRNSKLSKLNSFMKCDKKLDKIVKENKIEFIHAHVAYIGGVTTYLYCKKTKIPYIITEHRSNIAEFSQFYNRFLMKKAYKNAKFVIGVSKFLLDDIKSLGYEFNGRVLGNVVDVPLNVNHIESRIVADKLGNKTKLLWIGRMADKEIKGLNYLLPAIKEFVNKYKDKEIEVTFVGDGLMKQYYINFAKELNILDYCNFAGEVSKENIPGYIKKCDFLVVSSIKETFGSVIIEAMALGKPVLATKCGGPCEIVKDFNGILVSYKNSQSLCEGIYAMISQLKDFNSEEIIKYVKDNYSYKVIGQQLVRVYDEILNGNLENRCNSDESTGDGINTYYG